MAWHANAPLEAPISGPPVHTGGTNVWAGKVSHGVAVGWALSKGTPQHVTPHHTSALRDCAEGVPLPTAPRQVSEASEASEALYGRSATAHCPKAMRQ